MGIVSVSSWEEKLIVVGMRESQPTSWASTEQSETWAGELAAVFVLWRRTKSIYEQRSLIFLHVILLLFSIGYFPFLLLLVDLCVCSFVVVIFGPFFFWRLHCSWYIERGTDPQDLCVCVWFDYRSTQREPSHGTIIECRGNQSRWWRLLRLSRRCPPACQPHRMEERCTFKRLSLSLSLYLVSSFLSFFFWLAGHQTSPQHIGQCHHYQSKSRLAECRPLHGWKHFVSRIQRRGPGGESEHFPRRQV